MTQRCARCFLWTPRCICAEIPRVITRTRWLILRHALERAKPSNTGRFAAMALGCPLVDVYGPGEEPALPPIPEGTWLLFPDGRGDGTPPRPSGLVVVDGTWSQSRRMVQRLPGLARLPRLSLPASSHPLPRLRRSPRPDGMSTLEAAAEALALLEGEETARPLRVFQEEFVRRMRLTRST